MACCAVFKEGKGKGKEGKEREKGKRKKVEQKSFSLPKGASKSCLRFAA